jgi:hypothetical protein
VPDFYQKRHLLSTGARIPTAPSLTSVVSAAVHFVGIYSAHDFESIKSHYHLRRQIASEFRSHFTLFLVAALLCASHVTAFEANIHRGKKMDLTIKGHSSVNDLNIISTP